jgi:hypothetical protein
MRLQQVAQVLAQLLRELPLPRSLATIQTTTTTTMTTRVVAVQDIPPRLEGSLLPGHLLDLLPNAQLYPTVTSS